MSPIDYSITPWMDWMKAREGWNETKNDKELSAYWKYVHLDYHTVIGASHAWCAMTVNAALIESGYKGNGRADAVSCRLIGTPCPVQFGCILVIKHPNGHYHVTFFVRWIDEKNRLAECFGGNQSDALKKSIFNLSGNIHGHDEIVASRWPEKAPA